MENNENYGKMIFLSEDAKEKVRQMDDQELDILSSLLAHSIRNTQIKIQEEFNERRDQ